jgi:hypothetical protein
VDIRKAVDVEACGMGKKSAERDAIVIKAATSLRG